MITLAKTNQVDEILEIIEQTKIIFKNKGIDQWQNGYPNRDSIINDINNNSGYVYLDNDIVLGYFYIMYENEITYENIYEGDWLTNKPYFTIHRLTVNANCRRQGIASEMFKFISELAKIKNLNIRVDTHNDNKPMKTLLLKSGFKYCGIIELKDKALRNAYELDIRRTL